MPSYQKTMIMGHLGRDPEVKFLPDGKPLCNFSVAVNGRSKGEEWVDWYNISVFGRQAEACGQYLSKGRGVLVEGRLRLRPYQAKDGTQKISPDLTADNVTFLGKEDGTGERPSGSSSGQPPVLDELPF